MSQVKRIKASSYYRDWFSKGEGSCEELLHKSVGGIYHSDYHFDPTLPLFSIRKYTNEILADGKYGLDYVGKVLEDLGLGKKTKEVFVYGGCFHGDNPKLHRELLEINANYAFFSDITGSDKTEEGKRIFYNEVVNPAYPLIRKGISNHKLLYNKSGSINNKKNIRNGFLNLFTYKLRLEGRSEREIIEEKERLNDEIIAIEIRNIVNPKRFKYFGEWLGSLNKETRIRILKFIEDDTKKLIEVFYNLKKQGTKVFIVEGNWDNPKTLEQIAKGNGGVTIENYFNTKEYLNQMGFKLYSEIEEIITDTSYHIVAPYFALLKGLEAFPSYFKKNLAREASHAKRQHKTVVIYAHGVPYPSMHDMGMRPEISRENRKVAITLRQLMHMIEPHEVIYPHFHGLRLNEEKRVIPLNDDLISKVDKKRVPLLNGNLPINKKKPLAVDIYVPFRRIAIGTLMQRKTRNLFGDKNIPARVV